MKHASWFLLVLSLFLLVACPKAAAQTWDYIDVPPGYETLNLAVEGDTTAAGLPKSLNRVYRLARGGTYLLNGRIVNIKKAPLRVWAADGTGAKPVIIMAVDQTGANDDFASCEGPAHFKNLYISGIDDIGKQDRYTIAVYGDSTKVILDGVHIDHSRQSHIRTYGNLTRIFFLNCEFRNSIDLATPSNGRFFDGRGLRADSIVWINNTFYVNSQRMFRTDGALINNIIFDHNTFYQGLYGQSTTSGWKIGGGLELRRGINVRITNNIFQDFNLESLRHPATMNPLDRMPIIYVDSLGSEPESNRNWVVRNNAYGWSPVFKSFWAARADTVKPGVFISPYGDSIFFRTQPNFKQSGNFEELIQFTDAPTSDSLVKYLTYRYSTNFTGTSCPDVRADRNGIGSLTTNPGSFGLEANRFDFDYPTTQLAYTAGDGGFPLGDLNWFPSKKVLWESWVTSAGEENGVVTEFRLEQNYPNPFNPSTRIQYALPRAARVTLTVYNALGQEIAALINNQDQAPGVQSAVWTGQDASGRPVASGVYYCQLRADGTQRSIKMLLVK